MLSHVSPMTRRVAGAIISAWSLVAFLFFLTSQLSAQPKPTENSRLVVVISVDQMRADYLERFRYQYHGGLRRLQKQGAVLVDAHQNHAQTETGPGHSTLLSGCVPGHTGIIANEWYDRATGKVVYCVSSTRYRLLGSNRLGSSPELLKVTTLGDWLKAQSPHSKVISLSRKDRSAILMGGRHPDQVYWFDIAAGQFVTSEYYSTQYPAWFAAWKQLGVVDSYFGTSWERLSEKEHIYALSDPDTSPGEDALGTTAFPHRFTSTSGKPDQAFYGFLINTPFFDEITLKFAEAAIEGEKLGRRGTTDLLAIGLSVTDAIGHAFGPDSQEIQDQMLRLDRYLDRFLKSLSRSLDPNNYLVVLTADHGVMPLPEHLRAQRKNARRIGSEVEKLGLNLERYLETRLGAGKWLDDGPGGSGIYLNEGTARNHQLPMDKVVESAIEFLKTQPLVVEFFTRGDLASNSPTSNKFLERFRNSYEPTRSGDLQTRWPEYALPITRAVGTTHGSPYDYDSHVPLIFWGKPFNWGKHTQRVNTVDIAPTLASVLGIKAPENLDGQIISSILRKRKK